MTRVDAVLLDADGVIQTVTSQYREVLDAMSGDPARSDDLLDDLWTAYLSSS